MTIEQKAKAYDEALERAKNLRKDAIDMGENIRAKQCEIIFPELKESEDERIRKGIICGMNALKDQKKETFAAIPIDDCVAWLEKQHEKVEPKFHEGDWISHNTANFVFQVVSIGSYGYEVINRDNYTKTISFDNEENYHLWTIQDAKDGDVLATKKGNPFIYDKNRYNNGLAYYYAGLDVNKELTLKSPHNMLAHFGELRSVFPATKEQRDLLFQNMKEAGYEWDADKKEPKKIKQKSIQGDEEELTEFECLMLHIGQSFFGENAGLNPNDIKIVKEQANLLIGLIEHKSAWSEEDIKAFNRICAILVDASEVKNWWKEYRLIEREEMIRLTDFLKSLQHQTHWKPSEDQIDALKEAVYQLDGTEYSNGIDSLYIDLKKL